MSPPPGTWRRLHAALPLLLLTIVLAACSGTAPQAPGDGVSSGRSRGNGAAMGASAGPSGRADDRAYGAERPRAALEEPLSLEELATVRPARLVRPRSRSDESPSATKRAHERPVPGAAGERPREFRVAPSAESHVPAAGVAVRDFAAHRPYLRGVASWYGPGFHGKPTANGEIYNQYGISAAHPTLPLGTVIDVENEANGRHLILRVNDRGPYKKGRVLDLSRTAAQALGMYKQGTAPVRIRVVRWPRKVAEDPALKPYTQYVVQVAAHDTLDKAEAQRAELAGRFDDLHFWLDPRPNGYQGVVAGPFDDRGEALQVSHRLKRASIGNMVRHLRK